MICVTASLQDSLEERNRILTLYQFPPRLDLDAFAYVALCIFMRGAECLRLLYRGRVASCGRIVCMLVQQPLHGVCRLQPTACGWENVRPWRSWVLSLSSFFKKVVVANLAVQLRALLMRVHLSDPASCNNVRSRSQRRKPKTSLHVRA
jgi:hypothetical protein